MTKSKNWKITLIFFLFPASSSTQAQRNDFATSDYKNNIYLQPTRIELANPVAAKVVPGLALFAYRQQRVQSKTGIKFVETSQTFQLELHTIVIER